MADTPAANDTPLRDCVDQIWDMRAELWAGEGYDRLDTIVTDAYAAGRAAQREADAQLAERLDAEYPDYWGNPAKFAGQIREGTL